MSHRAGNIAFVIEKSRRSTDQKRRDDLLNKDHAPPCFLSAHPPHIKAQIHLLELLMKQQRDAHNFRLAKQKSHQAHVSLAIVGIDQRSFRRHWLEALRVNGKVEHRKITPLGRKESFLLRFCGQRRVGLAHALCRFIARENAERSVYEDNAPNTSALQPHITRQLHADDSEKGHSSATVAV